MLVGFANPAFESYRALEAYRSLPGPAASERLFELACYWVAAGALECLEAPLRGVTESVPFYGIAKVALLTWLQANRCEGAKRVVDELLSPCLRPWLATVEPVLKAVRVSLSASVALLQLDVAFAWLAKRVPGLAWFLGPNGGGAGGPDGTTWNDLATQGGHQGGRNGGGGNASYGTGNDGGGNAPRGTGNAGGGNAFPHPGGFQRPSGGTAQAPSLPAWAATSPASPAPALQPANVTYIAPRDAPPAPQPPAPQLPAAAAAAFPALGAERAPSGGAGPAAEAAGPAPSGGSGSRRWLSRALWRGDAAGGAAGTASRTLEAPPQEGGGRGGAGGPRLAL